MREIEDESRWNGELKVEELTSCMDEMKHAHNLSHSVWCAMSEDDDERVN